MNRDERRRAARMCLGEFVTTHFAPNFLLEASPLTHRAYGETVGHWRRLTDDPPLGEIDGPLLTAFKAGLRNPAHFPRRPRRRKPGSQRLLFETCLEKTAGHGRAPTLAAATVNKHLRHLGAILSKAGPPGPRNRDALGVLDRVPWTRPLRTYHRLPRDVKDDLLDDIYRATGVAEYPRIEGVAADNWWKALLVVALTAGFRKGALLALAWSDVDWERSEIRLAAEDDKCREERRKPVHELVLRHLMRIRSRLELVFAFPHSSRTFYREWHAIQSAARIDERRHVKLHDLKRACGTRFARIASPWAVQKRLDHASLATSMHYVNATHEELEAMDRLPIPAAFREDFCEPSPGEDFAG